MDKFQSELLAQFKEHNRLTKELVKLQRAAINEPKKVNTEIFSAVQSKPAHWIIKTDADGMINNRCSNCGWYMITYDSCINWTYCPKCGLEMKKEGEDNA